MPSKAKMIAICGFCGAVSTLCLLCCTLPAVKWIALALAVIASVAVSLPTLASGKVIYSVLTYLASATIGVIVGVSNILYVAPIVAFCMPMALVKVNAETVKVSTKMEKTTVSDPFGNGDDKQVVALQLDVKPKMKGFVKWILYYVVLEVSIALTFGATYLFMRPTFDLLAQNNLLVWVIVVFQLLPIPYDFLLKGCFNLTAKTLKRYINK